MALARAVYSNSEVVCLDDVLSAVDAHTARYIWDSCLIEGLLRNKKTVILVSHQIQYLSRPEVDSVIMLRNGSSVSSLKNCNSEASRRAFLDWIIIRPAVATRTMERIGEKWGCFPAPRAGVGHCRIGRSFVPAVIIELLVRDTREGAQC